MSHDGQTRLYLKMDILGGMRKGIMNDSAEFDSGYQVIFDAVARNVSLLSRSTLIKHMIVDWTRYDIVTQ